MQCSLSKLSPWILSFFVAFLVNEEPKRLGNSFFPKTVLAQAKSSANVIVYGRVNCPLTQNLMKELQKRKIAYLFKSVDLTATDQEMEQLAFENNVSIPSKYRLPAVGINNKIFFSSSGVKINQVLSELGQAPKFSSVQFKNLSQETIVIYTKGEDNYAEKLLKGLQKYQIKSQVKDIVNNQYKEELWQELKRIQYKEDYVDLPVVILNDKPWIRPKFPSLLAELTQSVKVASSAQPILPDGWYIGESNTDAMIEIKNSQYCGANLETARMECDPISDLKYIKPGVVRLYQDTYFCSQTLFQINLERYNNLSRYGKYGKCTANGWIETPIQK
ncbi:MAG: hypothetical protein GC158_09470 [Cyanobacteria bacterium RI_101]|nr:hypothetical protein [Cyanobacteria bacterium RI_101]